MQKLVWQNSEGDELDLTSGNYGITEWEGFSNAGLNIQSQQVPFQDGAVFLDVLIEPRELTITLAMQDNNNLGLRYQLRRELIHKLNPKLGEGYLIYTNDYTSKRIKCVPQIPLFENHNSNDSGTPKASLTWTANSPYWEDLEETVVEVQGGQTVINNGEIPAQVKITLPSLAKNSILINQTNQKSLELTGSYDDDIEINTNIGVKTVQKKEFGFEWNNGGTFYAIAYGDGKRVYAGTQTVIESLISGKYEQIQGGGTTNNAMIYANGYFVGVTRNGANISQDGINWSFSSITNRELFSITYGNGKWVAVGENGVIYTSEDLVDWTPRTSGVSQRLNGVTFGNNLFVAVGSGGNIFTSTDGETWTLRTSGVSTALWSASYGINLFIIVGAGGVILTSTNGTTWTSRTSGTSNPLYSVYYANYLYIAVGYSGTILTSTNGTTWTSRTSGVSSTLRAILYSGGMFTVAGTEGTILTSQEATEWTIKNKGYEYALNDIKYFNGKYIAVGYATTILVSEDKKTWTKVTDIGVGAEWHSIAYGNNLYVIVGSNGAIVTSADLNTWTPRTSGTSNDLLSVTYANNLFVAVGNGGVILTSSNGTSWTSRTSNTTNDLRSVIYGKSMFLVVGAGGVILTSTNGTTWTSRISGTSEDLLSATYGDRIYMVIGGSGNILTSTNGATWVIHNSGFQYMSCVIYNNQFIGVGYQGLILTSSDGITWTQRESATNLSLFGIVGNDTGYVVVGDNGIILESKIIAIENLISKLSSSSDMNFNLEVGQNQLLFFDDNDKSCVVKYRQKYIGV